MFKQTIIHIILSLCLIGIIIPQEFSSINPNYGHKGEGLYVEIELSDIDFYNFYNSYDGYTDENTFNGYNDYTDYWNDYISVLFYNDYNDYFGNTSPFSYSTRDFESEYNEIISSNTISSYINIPNYIESGLYSLYITLFKNEPVGQMTGEDQVVYLEIDAPDVFEIFLQGDLSGDEIINVIDIVALVGIIMDNEAEYNPQADISQDNIINVVDIVGLVNIILEQD